MTNIVDLLRKDYHIVLPNGKTVTSEYLHILKNYYKKQIYDSLGGKTVGKAGVIWSNSLDVVFPCAIAMWELGASVLMDNFFPTAMRHPTFKNFYQGVDFVVAVGNSADMVFTEVPHIPAVYSQMDYAAYINEQPEEPIYQFLPNEYPDVEYALDQPIDGNTVATTVYIRGQDGKPKFFNRSHYDACQTIKENIDFFNFTESDRVLHTKTLYHGNLLLQYTLPALASTRSHYWATMIENPKNGPKFNRINFLSDMLNTCQSSNITKCLLPPIWINDLAKCNSVQIPNTSIMTIYGPSKDTMKTLFDKFNFNTFYNNFGCFEGGTLAISKTTISNVEEYSPNQFEFISPMIDLDIHKEFFRTKLKTNDKWNTVPDRIEIVNNTFVFHGVTNKITINNTEINLDDANSKLLDYFKTEMFTLVPDYIHNQLYLAFFDNQRTWTCNEVISHTGIPVSKTAEYGQKWHFGDLSPTRYFSIALLLYAFQNQTVADYRPSLENTIAIN